MAIGLGGFSPAPACLASFRARGENGGDADGRSIGAAIAGGEAVVANVRRLAEAARLLGVPVVATEQNPAGLGGTIPALAPFPARRLEKRFFDATREEDFEGFLPAAGPQSSSRAARPMSASCRRCSGFSRAGVRSRSSPTPSAREARRT